MARRVDLCSAVIIAANGVVEIEGDKNQTNALSLRYLEAINGIVVTIQAATAAAGFTGGGAGHIKIQESSDGTNWSDIDSANVNVAAAEGTYTIRVNSADGTSRLPLKQKIRFVFYGYDSGNYLINMYIYRPDGQ